MGMKLTGKGKEDFEKWYIIHYEDQYEDCGNTPEEQRGYVELKGFPDGVLWCNGFYDLPKSMQYGVYVDFFDSVGIDVRVVKGLITQKFNYRISDITQVLALDFGLETRHEARTKAIEKANEIYNG